MINFIIIKSENTNIISKYKNIKLLDSPIVNISWIYLVVNGVDNMGFFIYEKSKDDLFITRIYVDTNFRRKGIGTEILKYIETIAENNKIGCIVLDPKPFGFGESISKNYYIELESQLEKWYLIRGYQKRRDGAMIKTIQQRVQADSPMS